MVFGDDGWTEEIVSILPNYSIERSCIYIDLLIYIRQCFDFS